MLFVTYCAHVLMFKVTPNFARHT